jgi:hypothetical protein
MRTTLLSTLALTQLLSTTPAAAADGWGGEMETNPQAESDTQPLATSVQQADILGEALEAPILTRGQHAWLKPTRGELPSSPRGQTDFTAYTLEWGETKLGLASITVGLLPRTHIGTVPVLDALGVPNAHVKVNPLRIGRYDLAVSANHFQLNKDEFSASVSGAGLIQSVQLAQPWSVHLGAHYSVIESSGMPTPSTLPSVLESDKFTQADVDAAKAKLGMDELSFKAEAVTLHIATDIRFNRRDSLILQAKAMTWANIETGFTPPPVLGVDEAMEIAESGRAPIAETYVASAAWQFSWKQVDLRVGAGVSNVPGAWLLQSTDLSYRFGGKTRRSESRMARTWKKNRTDTKR